jgi:hypothetical protein
MSTLSLKEKSLRISGRVKITRYRAGMVEAVTPYLQKLQALRRFSQEYPDTHVAHIDDTIAYYRDLIDSIKATFFIGIAADMKNLVMDSPGYGLDLIIQRLTGNNTYSLNILWIELGTGSTTPTVNDTALTTPSIRLPVSFQEDYGATDAIIQAYVADANLANGTYNEVGSFVDGTSTTGSGQIFNHALISPAYSKVSGQDTTVEIDFNIVNS